VHALLKELYVFFLRPHNFQQLVPIAVSLLLQLRDLLLRLLVFAPQLAIDVAKPLDFLLLLLAVAEVVAVVRIFRKEHVLFHLLPLLRLLMF